MNDDYFENEVYEEESNVNEMNEVYSQPDPISEPKREKKKSGFGRIAKKGAAIICAAALFGTVAGGALYSSNYILNKAWDKNSSSSSSSTKTKSTNPVDVKLTTADDGDDNESTSTVEKSSTGTYSVSEITEKCLPSVVAITNVGVSDVRTMWGTYQQESKSAGSGVIVAKTDTELLILTNYHVVSNSNELTVVFSFDEDSENPEAVSANLKGYDSSLDLAVIAINLDDVTDEILSEIAIAVVGNSDELILGEQVVAIGNALGYGQSVTTGIVSALNREVTLTGSNNETITNKYIQTDAAINPGNSGGALLNMKGELIGINSAKVSSSAVEGMGYAIPITAVYDEIEQMMNEQTEANISDKDKGYLGIVGENLDESTAMRYHLPQGVYISKAYEGYAAANAGIVVGDIITSVNGKEVTDMTTLKSELAGFKAGESVTVGYIRYDEDENSYLSHEAEVTLDDYDKFQEFSKLVEEDQEKEQKQNGNNGNGGNNGNNGYYDNDFWDYFYNN